MDLETLRSKYRDQILEIAERNHVENVRVFGSVARGDAKKNSDVDFLVHLLPETSLFDLGGIYVDLEELLECKVDVVDDENLNWYMRDGILNEAVPL